MAHFKCLRPHAAVSMFILCGLALFSLSQPVFGESARQLYFKGEACYQELSDHPEWQKYRARWKKCIEKFEKVHAVNPDGPWASAGLYMTGKLYAELYQHSYSPKDIQAARSIFSEIISTYPQSQYKERAQKAMARLPEVKSEPEASAKQAYFEAEACYKDLRQHPERQEYRVYWKNCIDQFAAVYQAHPDDPWAPAAMFMTARLYEELYLHSYSLKDKKKAAEIYERVTEKYPESRYREKARTKLNRMPDAIEDAITRAMPEADASPAADRAKDSDNSSMVTVTGIRYWSNAEYTRVVIDATQETSFQNNLLKKDPAIDKPYQRLYVDLNNTRLGDVEKKIPINDNLLRTARAAQYQKDVVRVVVDIKSFEDYNIFSLKNPFRIVIDVRGEPAPAKIASKVAPEDSIIRSLNLGVNRVVIDPGHGGKDYGAPGYLRGVHEKDVVLEISKKLAETIKKEIGCEVLLTRETDKYLTLEERTAIANTEKADLFISVHANAARNHRAFGIETYFLNLTTDEEAIAVAARENSTSRKNIGELDSILKDLLNNAKINESSRLATYVQDSLCSHLAGNYSRINNKGVKQAPFYVLLGAQMPSVLVETSFISNQRECRRLTDPAYQADLCEGIVQGLFEYIKEIQPKANYGPQQGEDAGS
ncbi:MAG: N-acetylmuramoyl-L-alanine amidase [Desulfobacterales bacterium]|nr:N-acetylmuramoyl-L-alanine amidase [Desulfobacterales bacterium]